MNGQWDHAGEWIEYPINPHFAPSCEDCEQSEAVVTIEVLGALTDLCRPCADWHKHHRVP